jgi:hypothetical protein
VLSAVDRPSGNPPPSAAPANRMDVAMSRPTFEQFQAHLRMLLRDQPRGTGADLTDFLVAYWTGREVAYVFLREDDPSLLDEGLDLTANEWEQWQDELLGWYSAPRFSPRAELELWLRDSPPREGGPI